MAGVALLSLLFGTSGCGGATVQTPQVRLRVATTSSLYDTGLWALLEPIFEKDYDVALDILYATTGAAMQYATRGDVDVIAVHSKTDEEKFIADGYGVERNIFAYNYFLIVGPETDPAGINGFSPQDAFKKFFDTKSAKFVSRGDTSGTMSKEKAIWKAAGLDYETVRNSGQWYVEAGQGMGPTLEMANQLQAYTLTDIGTFLAYKKNKNLDLVSIADQGSILLNVYSVIAVNPAKFPAVNNEMANNLITFLTSEKIQKLIGEYGVKDFGRALFTPCAGEPEPTQ